MTCCRVGHALNSDTVVPRARGGDGRCVGGVGGPGGGEGRVWFFCFLMFCFICVSGEQGTCPAAEALHVLA